MTGSEFNNLTKGDIIRHNSATVGDAVVVIGVVGKTAFVGRVTHEPGGLPAAVVQTVAQSRAAEWTLVEKHRE